jgi:2-C-methyl-D-erythritol 4-phosphate cytidylyltransferase
MNQFSIILPAAGRSTRFGGPVSKVFQHLLDRPVLSWTIAAFANRDDVAEIVIAASDRAGVEQCLAPLAPGAREKVRICDGGSCRAESVLAALKATSEDSDWIAVHDAARPLASKAVIDRTFAAGVKYGAAAAALPVHLTIKQADGPLPARVQKTVPRTQLWAMQTPQVARRSDLLAAFAMCPIPLEEVTDDVQLLELAGKEVWLVNGDERNLKITTPIDLQLAAMWLENSPEPK